MMKRLIWVLAMLCATALCFCALAEQSATVTVRGIGENVTVTLVMEDETLALSGVADMAALQELRNYRTIRKCTEASTNQHKE